MERCGTILQKYSKRITVRKLRVIYEDNWLIVIEKPSGLLSVGHPTAKNDNAWHLVRSYVKQRNPHGDAFVCHRLDQFTSGILMFSKSEAIQHQLRDNWNDYVLDRRYVAVTEVIPSTKKAEIRSYLAENSALFVHSTRDTTIGKLAITRFKVIAENKNMALLDVQILTGRKNQIRVHLSEHGWPIAGDKKYGAKTSPENRLMLHNNRLVIVHPVTHQQMVFESPIPKSFLKYFETSIEPKQNPQSK